MAQSQVIYLSSHPSVFLSTSSTLLSYFQCKGKEEKGGGVVYPTVKRCMSGDFKDVTSQSLINTGGMPHLGNEFECIYTDQRSISIIQLILTMEIEINRGSL